MNNNQHQNNKTKKVTTAIVGGKPINFTSKKQEVHLPSHRRSRSKN
jgi:hypothetical protein